MGQARVVLSWSTGKDSAWALHRLRGTDGVEVVGLLATVNTRHDRVAMHATRRALLEAQARAAGLALHIVPLPWPCPNGTYEQAMRSALAALRAEGVTHLAFGDLFLEDVRAWRERLLDGTGIAPLFPLWGADTARLARQMLAAGLEAVVTCVDPRRLPRALAGARYDGDLLDRLPAGVDPCGENGEFHTCVLAGPMLRGRIAARPGPVVERDGFVFADLVPVGGPRAWQGAGDVDTLGAAHITGAGRGSS